MAAQHPREGGLGNRDEHQDLGIAAAIATQSQDLPLEVRWGATRLSDRNAGSIAEPFGVPGCTSALQPAANGSFAHSSGRWCGPRSEREGEDVPYLLRSTKRRQAGISAHAVRAEGCGFSVHPTVFSHTLTVQTTYCNKTPTQTVTKRGHAYMDSNDPRRMKHCSHRASRLT